MKNPISINLLTVVLLFVPSAPAREQTAQKEAVDRYGDPLPEGAIARLGTARFRHGARVMRLGFALGGKVIASTGRLPGLCLWDAKTGKVLHQLALPEYQFGESLAISPDGTKLITALSLVDVASGKEIRRFKAADTFGACSAFSRDGKTVAHGSRKKITLFDVGTGNELHQLPGHGNFVKSVAFSPTDNHILASAGFDRVVRIWDTNNGKELHRLVGHGEYVHSVAFAPDGKVLASGGADRVLRLWDVGTGKPIRNLTADSSSINEVVFSPDARILACCGAGGIITLWDPKSGMKIRQWTSHVPFGGSLAFEPKGKTIATTSVNGINLWDVETGKEIKPAMHVTPIVSVRYGADGKTLQSCGSWGTIFEWNLASPGDVVRRFAGSEGPTRTGHWITLSVAADGEILAQARITYPKYNRDSVIRIWDNVAGKPIHLLKGHAQKVLRIEFSPDGKRLASSGPDGIRLWDMGTGKPLHHFPVKAHTDTLAFSPDGKTLASADRDKRIHLWDVGTGTEKGRWEAGDDYVLRLAFAPDGKILASATRNIIQLWSAQTGKEIGRHAGKGRPSTLAFSPSGRVLAVARGGADSFRTDEYYEGKIQLWEVATGQPIRQFSTRQGVPTDLAFSPRGEHLASAGADSTILIWDLAGIAHAKWTTPTAANLETLWKELAGDAVIADRALWHFTHSPKASTTFLKERMRMTSSPNNKVIAELLVDLESKKLKARQTAEAALLELGESAEAALRKRLASNPPLELRRRVQIILAKREPEVLRQLRAIDTLEQIATQESREVLATLAKSSSNPRVVQAAEAALSRFVDRK